MNGHNPVPGGIATRFDAGVDYTASTQDFVAIFDMKVVLSFAWAPGWAPHGTSPFTDAAGGQHGDGYMALEIVQDCPLKGQVVYYSEGIKPLFGAGATVKGGTRIADRVFSLWNGVLGNCELGWAVPSNPGMPLAHSLAGYSGDQSRQAIACAGSFDALVTGVGGPAGHNNTGAAPDYSLLPPVLRPSSWPRPRDDTLPLTQGESGPRVVQVQKALDHRGFSLATDGAYGPATAGAVSLWQRVHGRAQTGEIAKGDWTYMFPLLSVQVRNTWPGATQALQHALDAHGYSLKQDGDFGPATQGAVKQFQQQHGLTADGVVGRRTWRQVV